MLEPVITRGDPAVTPKQADILNAAHALFMELGYGATSMDAIAARAGVSKRTIYSHFESKDGLFGAMMDAACERIGGQPVLTLPPGSPIPDLPPGAALRQMGRRFLTIIYSPEGVSVFRIVINEAHRFPDLAQAFQTNGIAPLQRALCNYVASRVEAGDMRAGDVVVVADAFVSLLKGEHLEVMIGVRPPPGEEEIARIVDRAVGQILTLYGI